MTSRSATSSRWGTRAMTPRAATSSRSSSTLVAAIYCWGCRRARGPSLGAVGELRRLRACVRGVGLQRQQPEVGSSGRGEARDRRQLQLGGAQLVCPPAGRLAEMGHRPYKVAVAGPC